VFFRKKLYETVDPLVPARPATVRRHAHRAFYFRVHTRRDTAAGRYKGTITMHAANAEPRKLTLEVEVWPYAIPERWNFNTMGNFCWGHCARFHKKQWTDKLQREYYDFLLEHRFSPVEQYANILSPRRDLEYCIKRGLSTIIIAGGRMGTSEADFKRYKQRYEKVKKLKALDRALLYIGDETNKWDKMRRVVNLIHAHLPGAKVMIGGSFPRKELAGYIDVYDPLIGGGSKTYSLKEANTGLIAEAQKRGEEFYWYVAAGPAYPYPNVQVEYPLSDARALF
jgi:hypothetical protein